VRRQLKDKVSVECIRRVAEREKSSIYNESQKNDLRREIVKIEFHCIFDALNEQLIKKRLKFNGYSGIGLNELTLITFWEPERKVGCEKQYQEMLAAALRDLQELVGSEKSSGEKLLLENYERLCENDSEWIYYSEEALSFGLEFVYMLEDEIMVEETACIFRQLSRI
jgi:hypothetical protein